MFENIIDNFIMGNYIFIPDKDNKFMTESLLKGNIYYNFFTGEYKTIESLEEKINKLCVLIVNKNKFAVGLEYICGEFKAPVLILKTFRVKWITKICKDNGINIVYDEKIATHIFYYTEEHSIIPSSIWEDVAEVFVKILMAKDKTFLEKTKCK
jgi:flagellar biosynthesis protein FlhB